MGRARALGAMAFAAVTVACAAHDPVRPVETAHPSGGPVAVVDLEGLLHRLEAAVARGPGSSIGDSPDAPSSGDARARAEWHLRRGRAAARGASGALAVVELRRAWALARDVAPGSSWAFEIGRHLVDAELGGGVHHEGLELAREIARSIDPLRASPSAVVFHEIVARESTVYSRWDDVESAARAAVAAWESRPPGLPPAASIRAEVAAIHARVYPALRRNRQADAEALRREALALMVAHPETFPAREVALQECFLSDTLVRLERLAEAEVMARRGLSRLLGTGEDESTYTGNLATLLARVTLAQGRFEETLRLARAALALYERNDTPPVSRQILEPRRILAAALVGAGRMSDALVQYERVRDALQSSPLPGAVRVEASYVAALVRTGRAREAVAAADELVAQIARRYGHGHRFTEEADAFRALAMASSGHRERARLAFERSATGWLARPTDVAEDTTLGLTRELRLAMLVSGWVDLLADAGPDDRAAAIATAFTLADRARARAARRAIGARVARESAGDDERRARAIDREHVLRNDLAVAYREAIAAEAVPAPGRLARLRAAAETIRRVYAAYADATRDVMWQTSRFIDLVEPPPASPDDVRASLAPGEILIAMFAGERDTFVWAIAPRGPVHFHVAPIGSERLRDAVMRLRPTPDPAWSTARVPPFDVDLAHDVFRLLLEPAEPVWRSARTLLIVPHGPLASLPFALLPRSRSREPVPGEGLPFSEYRGVDWLIRSHAIVTLPSASTLGLLRSRSASAASRPFVGFGDPVYGVGPDAAPRAGEPDVDVPLAMRASGARRGEVSRRLTDLPRLPDTGDELRDIALALGADASRDVFLGSRASESSLRSLDLRRFRVVAFATHGLRSGDVDGLVEPALALSPPSGGDNFDDGLLTADEISRLRLDADWVVLSACNTAEASTAGGDPWSGLARAFFHAGARSILVTHWPVESRAARRLTAALFADAGAVDRARAAQRAMLRLIDHEVYRDAASGRALFTFAHPLFWATFALIGDPGTSSPVGE